MGKTKAKTHREYVNHPRYGNQPMHSDFSASIEEIMAAHWSYDERSIFPDSAIKADINKQNYSVFPRTIYVDIEKQCVQCNRWFIFFAEEQKYWYETLEFYIDADCIKCIDCRKKEQSIKHMMLEYEKLVISKNRSHGETKKLKNIALELYQLGYIRDRNKIDKIG
jgi:hypothetical protein